MGDYDPWHAEDQSVQQIGQGAGILEQYGAQRSAQQHQEQMLQKEYELKEQWNRQPSQVSLEDLQGWQNQFGGQGGQQVPGVMDLLKAGHDPKELAAWLKLHQAGHLPDHPANIPGSPWHSAMGGGAAPGQGVAPEGSASEEATESPAQEKAEGPSGEAAEQAPAQGIAQGAPQAGAQQPQAAAPMPAQGISAPPMKRVLTNGQLAALMGMGGPRAFGAENASEKAARQLNELLLKGATTASVTATKEAGANERANIKAGSAEKVAETRWKATTNAAKIRADATKYAADRRVDAAIASVTARASQDTRMRDAVARLKSANDGLKAIASQGMGALPTNKEDVERFRKQQEDALKDIEDLKKQNAGASKPITRTVGGETRKWNPNTKTWEPL